MYNGSNLSKIEEHCNQLMNSPYLQKEVPAELKNLRTILERIAVVIKEDVPTLVTEVRHLRSQNKKLEAEIEALRSSMTEISRSPEPAKGNGEAVELSKPLAQLVSSEQAQDVHEPVREGEAEESAEHSSGE